MSTVGAGSSKLNVQISLRRAKQIRDKALERQRVYANYEPNQLFLGATASKIEELTRERQDVVGNFMNLIDALQTEGKSGTPVDNALFERLGERGTYLQETYRTLKGNNTKNYAEAVRNMANAKLTEYLEPIAQQLLELEDIRHRQRYLREPKMKGEEISLRAEAAEVREALDNEYERAQAEVDRLQALQNAFPPTTIHVNHSLNRRNATNTSLISSLYKDAQNRALLASNPAAFFGTNRIGKNNTTRRNQSRSFPLARSVAPRIIEPVRNPFPTRNVAPSLAVHPLGRDARVLFSDIEGLKFLVNAEFYTSVGRHEIFEHDVLCPFAVIVSKLPNGKDICTRVDAALTNRTDLAGNFYRFTDFHKWARSFSGELVNPLDPEQLQIMVAINRQYIPTRITHIVVKLPIYAQFLSYKRENPVANFTRANEELVSRLRQFDHLSLTKVSRYLEPLSDFDEPVFQNRDMMENVRIGTHFFVDVARLRIGSYEPVLEWLEPYADHLICCIPTKRGRMYVRFHELTVGPLKTITGDSGASVAVRTFVPINELTEMERRTYPVLIDLSAIANYASPPINIVDREYLMADFKATQVTLTPVAAMREVIQTQEAMQKATRRALLNRYDISSSASSLHSEGKGGEEYHASSASSRGDSPINLWERRLRKLAGVNNAPSFGGGSSESKGDSEYRASSPFASSLHSESKGESSPSAGATSSMGIKESESLLGSSSSAASASPMIAGGPYGSSSAASAPQSAKQTFWGGLTGTVSSFLKPPPLHEKTPGPLGLPKRSRQTRRRARRRRLTRAA